MSKQFYTVKAEADKIRIDIYGDIVADAFWKWSDDDKCPSDISNALKSNPAAPVEVHINSGGGDAFSGEAIYNILKTHAGKKTVYVDGLAASSASYIAMAGDEIVVPNTAHVMIHAPWTTVRMANAKVLQKAIDMLDSVQEAMMKAYMSRAIEGIDEATIKALVEAETWMTGEKAAKYFKITTTDLSAVACVSDYFERYTNTPSELKVLPTPPAAGANPPAPPAPTAPTTVPPASDAMTVGDELAIVSSFIFAQREELNNE